MLNPFLEEEPSDTRMLPCPSCQEIVDVSTRTCRYCGAQIDETTARQLNADFQRVTDAVARANTFKQTIWLAVLLAFAGPLYLLLTAANHSLVIVLPFVPVGCVVYAISWHRKYGSLKTRDKDYPDSVRSMRIGLIVWAGCLIVQAAFLAYVFWSGMLIAD